MKKKYVLGTVIICILLGGIAGYVLSKSSQKTDRKQNSMCSDSYELLSDTVDCSSAPSISKNLYTSFIQDLTTYINLQNRNGDITEFAVYFRDLKQGPTFGIHEKNAFAPASLLKLPLLLTFYNLSESNPNLLKKKISYSGKTEVLNQKYNSSPDIIAHKDYTIDFLGSVMIQNSDNLAYILLFNALKELYPEENVLEQTMLELGLVSPRNLADDTISVKAYASLFRQLYNASYLNPQNSEKALELLSKTSYENGIVAGVPKNIRVAHKFGERVGLPGEIKQFHDCGIIYYPTNPYLLCIMTKGKELSKQEDIIKTISKKVYEEVNSRRLTK